LAGASGLGDEVREIADVRLLVRALQHFRPEVSVLQSRLIKNPAVVCTDMDEGGVLLDLETTAYYSLNRSALRIWSLIDDAPTLDEIAARLTSEFAIDYEHALASATQLVTTLERERLIRTEPAEPLG
jgi:hypothetical protein